MLFTERGRGAGGVTLRFRREAVEVKRERVVAEEDEEEEIEGRDTPMNRFVLCRSGKFSSNGESIQNPKSVSRDSLGRGREDSPLASEAMTTASANTTKAVSSDERDRCGVESGRGSGRCDFRKKCSAVPF